MRINSSLKLKVFAVAVFFIIAGQTAYALHDAKTFKNSYLELLREKSDRIGKIVRREIEYLLGLTIPFNKLVKMESVLQEVLAGAPEVEFIEVSDRNGNVLYFADQRSAARFEPGERKSQALDQVALDRIGRYGLTASLTDSTMPIKQPGSEEKVGRVRIRLSAEAIASKSREILLDMITAILVSLLITFEFITFFAAYGISDPLAALERDMKRSISSGEKVREQKSLLTRELAAVTNEFNRFIEILSRGADQVRTMRGFPGAAGAGLLEKIRMESRMVQDFFPDRGGKAGPQIGGAVEKISAALSEIERILSQLSGAPPSGAYASAPVEGISSHVPGREAVPYAYIRPIVFLSMIADGLSVSFLPMFIKSFDIPIVAGISRDVLVGLPITIHMLFFAVSMPIAGIWVDASGWRKPLAFGMLLNSAGQVLTSLCGNYAELVACRSLTAFGFGIVFIAFQQFIVDNTDSKTRARGMASFLSAFFGGDLCGTVIGGMFADRIGYRGVFLLGGIIAFLALFMATALFWKSYRAPGLDSGPSHHRFSPGDLLRVIRDREFCAIVFLQGVPAKVVQIGFLYYLVPLYLYHLRVLQSDIGRVLMVYGFALIFLGPLFSKLSQNQPYRKYYVLAGGVMTALSMLGFHYYSGLIAVTVLVAIIGVSHTMSMPSQAAYIAELDSVQAMGAGKGMGLFRFWERLGNITGPIILGILFSRYGFEGAVSTLGGILIACCVGYLAIILALQRQAAGSKTTATF